MKSWRAILVSAVAVGAMVLASSAAAQESKAAASKAGDSPAAHEATAGREYSGMYSFLKDGEFVQITVEDAGRVTGFVSRYGEGESDKGAFLDQYFRSGKLDGNKLSFTTETVHAVWFEFRGTVERGEGKNPGDEGYYALKGTLVENTSDAEKKVTSHEQEVALKIFPRN
jgi:opacity protein-like surface antigen